MRNILDFEKNISDLQKKITKLRESDSDKSSLIEVNEQIEQIKALEKNQNPKTDNMRNFFLLFLKIIEQKSSKKIHNKSRQNTAQ